MPRAPTERLVATVRHLIDGRWVKPGQSFEVPANQVAGFVRNRWATRMLEPERAPEPFQPQLPKADESPQPQAGPEPRRASGTRVYRRRDLTAEGTSE